MKVSTVSRSCWGIRGDGTDCSSRHLCPVQALVSFWSKYLLLQQRKVVYLKLRRQQSQRGIESRGWTLAVEGREDPRVSAPGEKTGKEPRDTGTRGSWLGKNVHSRRGGR